MYYKYLDYILKINPFIKEEDLAKVVEVNDWDVLIYLKDGRKYIYDTFTGYHRQIHYDDVRDIPEEQERRRFGIALKEIMDRKGITQDELADRIGTSQTMISRYVSGYCIPGGITLLKIAKVLNCSMDDLFCVDYNKYLEEE